MIFSLDKLFIKYGTDKSSAHHNYSPYYEKHLSHLLAKPVRMVIAGIGGYEYPNRGGGDIKAFCDYFTRSEARFFAFDIHDKSGIDFQSRVKVFQGDQADGKFLTTVMEKCGKADVIIDDASHLNAKTIQTFKHLFPWLKSGGIYVIEDIESSWWNEHGFDGQPNFMDFKAPTTINLCRELLNCVNVGYIGQDYPVESSYGISEIHFYPNIALFIATSDVLKHALSEFNECMRFKSYWWLILQSAASCPTIL